MSPSCLYLKNNFIINSIFITGLDYVLHWRGIFHWFRRWKLEILPAFQEVSFFLVAQLLYNSLWPSVSNVIGDIWISQLLLKIECWFYLKNDFVLLTNLSFFFFLTTEHAYLYYAKLNLKVVQQMIDRLLSNVYGKLKL